MERFPLSLSSHTFRIQNGKGSHWAARKLLNLLEAAIGIEPMNKGFAEIPNLYSRRYIE
jgi:hypothetical protein